MPFRKRIGILWSALISDLEPFIIRAVRLSAVRDIFDQITGFMTSAYKPLCSVDDNDVDPFFKTYLSCLSDVFDDAQGKQAGLLPESIAEILQWTLAFTASITRHRSLHGLMRTMIQRDFSAEQARALFSDTHSCGPDLALQLIAELTETPEHFFTRDQSSGAEVVSQNGYCSPSEWDAAVATIQRKRDELNNAMQCARKELDRMLLDFPSSDAIDAFTVAE